MAYEWRPTASRAATTTVPLAVVPPQRKPTREMPTQDAPAQRMPTRAPPPSQPREDLTLAETVDDFLEAAEDGTALNRSGRRYRPSALRDLRSCLRNHVAPELGHMGLDDVRRQHLQALVDRLAAEGLSESRIRSVVSAVRALYGYAIDQGYVSASPATGLAIPAERSDLDVPDETWEDEPPVRRRPAPDRQPARAREPAVLLPERLLSFALKLVFAIFILVVVVSIAGAI